MKFSCVSLFAGKMKGKFENNLQNSKLQCKTHSGVTLTVLAFVGWTVACSNVLPQPDPNNCDFYYKCLNGEMVRFECPSDLRFNPRLYVCDRSVIAGCENSQRIDEECDPEQPTETTTKKPNVGGCPDSGIAFLPHANDCNKYYQCLDGTQFEFGCAPDLHFSPIDLTCMWPTLANC